MIGRHPRDAVNCKGEVRQGLREVIGDVLDMMAARREAFRHPQDADRRAARKWEWAGCDDGNREARAHGARQARTFRISANRPPPGSSPRANTLTQGFCSSLRDVSLRLFHHRESAYTKSNRSCTRVASLGVTSMASHMGRS